MESLAWSTGKRPKTRPNALRACAIGAAALFAICFISYSLTNISFGPIDIGRLKPSSYNATGTKALTAQQAESSSLLFWDYAAYNNETLGMRPEQSYHTVVDRSPLFQINTWKPRATEGSRFLFMTPAISKQASSVQIYSRKDLSLVYSNFDGFRATNDFRVQMHNGKPYLTFWEGRPASGHGQGNGYLYNENYQMAYNLSINTFNTSADSHEFQLTDDGGALMTAYETVTGWDMTPVGGPKDGVLQDSCFEEVDVETGETRFAWRASDWFSITDTAVGYNDKEDYGHPTHGDGWDFFHINSLEKTRDGNYLVVGRRINVVTLINGKTGEPIWILGGKQNQFEDLSDGRATHFGYQHHARFDNDDYTEIVMFDNAELANKQPNPGCAERCSRGLHIRLDFKAMTALAVGEFYHPFSVQARAEGSSARQPNGNMLVGWGKVPSFTEYAPDGEVLLDVQTGPWSGSIMGDAHVYRIHSMDWKAYPPWPPMITMFEDEVFVSWNGATEVAYWALFTGDTEEKLEVQNVVTRGGFETKLSLPAEAPFARAAALDKDGSLLGSTNLLNLRTSELIIVDRPLQMEFTLQK